MFPEVDEWFEAPNAGSVFSAKVVLVFAQQNWEGFFTTRENMGKQQRKRQHGELHLSCLRTEPSLSLELVMRCVTPEIYQSGSFAEVMIIHNSKTCQFVSSLTLYSESFYR